MSDPVTCWALRMQLFGTPTPRRRVLSPERSGTACLPPVNSRSAQCPTIPDGGILRGKQIASQGRVRLRVPHVE